MSDDLVRRLGIIARAEMSNYAERTVNEAAAALIAKDEEIARLRDALRPFAQEHAWGPNDRFEIVIAGQYGSIKGSDLDRARAALEIAAGDQPAAF